MIATGTHRLRWYGFVYRAAYRLGLTVWERQAPPAGLVELVEGPAALAPGRALDIGCGTGTGSVYLAGHGWEVTGVDMVPRALAAARRRAAASGVSVRYVQGDATRLPELGLGTGYALLLDFGCYHTLPDDQRGTYVESVSEVAAAGATLLLYGFGRPPRIAPMRAGITPEGVRQRFADHGWELVGAERVDRQFELWGCRLRRLE